MCHDPNFTQVQAQSEGMKSCFPLFEEDGELADVTPSGQMYACEEA